MKLSGVWLVVCAFSVAACACGGGGPDAEGTKVVCEDLGLVVPSECAETVAQANAECLELVLDEALELTVVPESPIGAFSQPVAAVEADSGWYVAEQAGSIRRFVPPRRQDGVLFSTPPELVLDLRELIAGAGPEEFWESGLLGLALHPDFPNDPRAFVHYMVPVPLTPDQQEAELAKKPARSIVASFEYDRASRIFDRESQEILIDLHQPGLCHNGGSLLFDEGGYLLASFGDGCVDSMSSQDVTSFYGALLRIDINGRDDDRGTPFRIPPDNPFASTAGYAPEVISYGFRNPWRVTVDRETGDLWAGDVGEKLREEVNKIEFGVNWGWPRFEGFRPKQNGSLAANADSVGFPVTSLCRGEASSFSITGGYVYRGSEIPDLVGTYVFADGMSGTLLGIPADSTQRVAPRILGTVPGSIISSFFEDVDGELYVLDRNKGQILSLVGGPPAPQPPVRLSRNRFVTYLRPKQPRMGSVRWDVNQTFFSDHAAKERWFLLPEDGHIEVDQETGNLIFPVDTDFVKVFLRDGSRLETRLLRQIDDEHWRGWTWEWADQQNDALLLDVAKVVPVGDSRWYFPGRGDCLRCHTAAAGHTLGLNIAQLSSRTGPGAPDQLDDWIESGLLQISPAELGSLRERFPPIPALDDENVSLDDRARAFLQVNCSSCHRPDGPGDGKMDLRRETALLDMGICDVEPSVPWPDVQGARIVAPGEPDRSVLLARLLATGRGRMHPYRLEVDHAGADLITRWIEKLDCR